MNNLDIEWNNLRRVLEEYADFFIQEARDNLGRYGAYASGSLADSMKVTPENIVIEDDKFSVSVELNHYWKFLEMGTQGLESSPAGAKCKAHRPPVPAIKEWINVKGIGSGNEKDDLGFAIAISKSIEKRGLPPKPFFKEAKETTYEKFETAISYALQADLDEYVENTLMMYYNMLAGL